MPLLPASPRPDAIPLPYVRSYNPADPAVPASAWGMIQDFRDTLAAHRLVTCSHCNERWFEMKLVDSVCARCTKTDKNQTVWKFGADNIMQPNFVPPALPELRQLPLIPEFLEVAMRRPAHTVRSPRLRRQFVRDLRVRRRYIAMWLQFLRLHHPGYADI